MLSDTQPDANGIYWKGGKLYCKTSPGFYIVMIPAMIGTWAVIAWAGYVLLTIFL